MRSSVAFRLLSRRQRIVVAALLTVVLSLALLVAMPVRPAFAATCPCTIWSAGQAPANPSENDPAAVEVGVKFRSDSAGSITGIRFYKGTGNSGTHIGSLWSSTGSLLASVTFTGESASGWQQATFGAPVSITAATTYVASYYAPSGHYAADAGYFTGRTVTSSPLTALADGTDGGNGVYRYGTGGGFPASTYQASNYWVDVVFANGAPDTTKPTVTARAPAAGATNVPTSSGASATFSEPVQPATIAMTMSAPSGPVSATESYDPATRIATLTPAASLAVSTTYTVNLTGAADPAGNVMDPLSWTFTTGATSSACPCTIWPNSTTPSTPAANDSSAVELGVKFRADRAGYITGLRFYKGTGNTGTHVGSLWNATGTKLGSVTFTGESATGWQQATLGSPVPVAANTTYVASYYAPVGHYAAANSFFASAATTTGPLTALQNGTDGGNGVYRYGASGFPSSTYQSSNYYVDVVFDVNAVDTTAPTVASQTPAAGAGGVPTTSTVTATFSEPVVSSSIQLQGPGNTPVPATVTYDAPSQTATLTPTAALATTTGYTVTVSGARDAAGNTMTPVSWTFTTAAPPPPPPDQGPGGPIAVVTSSSNPYSKYLAEILRAEGLNEFATIDVSTLSAATLASYDVVVLGNVPVSAATATDLSTWVNGGGNLIAMRPSGTLTGLLGLTTASGTTGDAYLKVDPTTAAGAGIVSDTIQYHGDADRYSLSGASAIATIYSDASTATTFPAVTLRSVGSSGGEAAAFSYDLARSVALTRQGNPAWAGTERDGQDPIRSDDQFFGGTSPDWVDLNKVAIPQADEQQRLLANLVQVMNRNKKPLPHFWYFPNSLKAVVLATGDDHGNGGTAGRFDQYAANSPAGCSVANWTCLRFSSYIYPSTPLSNSAAVGYTGQGFEVGVHAQNGCTNYTPTSLTSAYANDLAAWRSAFPSLPSPSSNRFHCIVFSDWSSQPKTELANGMRLEGNYYYWPASWQQDRPGFMTGSGMPMRFTDTDGSMIDVYQATSQMTDESGQSYPFTPDSLLDNALGAAGYYGVFNANMHTDNATTFEDDQLIASATARGVPMISGRQLLSWIDGRNGSSFGSIAWNANALTFTVAVGAGANGLTGMVPTAGPNGTVLSGLSLNGTAVATTTSTIKGLEYAFFPAAAGNYTATYAPVGTGGGGLRATPSLAQLVAGAAAPVISNVRATAAQALTGPAAAFAWHTNVPASSDVALGTTPDGLSTKQGRRDTTRDHAVRVTGLSAGTTYYYRVTSTDPSGNTQTYPAVGQPPASFTTPAADRTKPVATDPVVSALPDGTAQVAWTTNEPADSQVRLGGSANSLSSEHTGAAQVQNHQVVVTDLQPNRTYWFNTTSTDAAGNAVTGRTVPLVTPGPGVAEQSSASFRRGTTGGQATIASSGLGSVTLTGDAKGTSATARVGSFVSGILDARAMVDWDRMSMRADVPTGSALTVRVRTGSTAVPDATWSSWHTVAVGDRVGGGSRYIQYSVVLASRANVAAPALYSIAFGNNGTPPAAPKETG